MPDPTDRGDCGGPWRERGGATMREMWRTVAAVLEGPPRSPHSRHAPGTPPGLLWRTTTRHILRHILSIHPEDNHPPHSLITTDHNREDPR